MGGEIINKLIEVIMFMQGDAKAVAVFAEGIGHGKCAYAVHVGGNDWHACKVKVAPFELEFAADIHIFA